MKRACSPCALIYSPANSDSGDRTFGAIAPLGVHVYHIDSKFKPTLEMKTACVTDAEGNAVCESPEDDAEPPIKKPRNRRSRLGY